MNLHQEITDKINQYGFFVMGVFGGKDEPSFAYTIGLSDKFGHELIIVGLPPHHAHTLLVDIYTGLLRKGPLPLDVPVPDLANLPLMFKRCLPALVRKYATQAFNYYGRRDIAFVQMVMPDAHGHFPEHPDYNWSYMGPRQPLLYKEKEVRRVH